MPAAGQQRTATVGFWNVENLFDTIPNMHYDDRAFTPQGRNKWNTARYESKLANLARVIDQMALDVIGLCEVENEGVVRDLALRLRTDYNFIILEETARAGGRNLALLYKGDKFIPADVRTIDSRTSRMFLYVRGELHGRRIDIVVVHLPSKLNSRAVRERALDRLRSFADSLHTADTASRLLILGDFNAAPRERIMRRTLLRDSMFFSPLATLAADGAGSYVYNGRWLLYDNIFLCHRLFDNHFGNRQSGIFIKPYMLHNDRTRRGGWPLRTFTGRRYTGGFSDHLPVWVALEVGD